MVKIGGKKYERQPSAVFCVSFFICMVSKLMFPTKSDEPEYTQLCNSPM